ncbi:hypothetical protein EVA_02310 [gut metagenome]|uniref:Uncharacterized protein n=1 Tax=gut metagenome TaxID=749906 RepID=J9D9S8_9ZZZZ
MFGTYMEEHALCAVVLEIMAVYTVVVVAFIRTIVLIDSLLLEISKVALVDSHLAVEFVARFNQAVGQKRVDILLCHMEFVGRKLKPLAVALAEDVHLEIFALVVLQQLAPCCGVQLNFAVFSSDSHDFLSIGSDARHESLALFLYHEVERSYIGGNYDVAVVGEYRCRIVESNAIRRHLGIGVAGQEREQQGKGIKYFFHVSCISWDGAFRLFSAAGRPWVMNGTAAGHNARLRLEGR